MRSFFNNLVFKGLIFIFGKKLIMKCLVFCSLVILIGFSAFTFNTTSSLENTKWQGTLYAPDAYEGILEFKTDSFFVYVNGDLVETMIYRVSADTMVIEKLSGDSPCGTEAGKYTYKIENDKLFFTGVEDMCTERFNVFSKDGYAKLSE